LRVIPGSAVRGQVAGDEQEQHLGVIFSAIDVNDFHVRKKVPVITRGSEELGCSSDLHGSALVFSSSRWSFRFNDRWSPALVGRRARRHQRP
jgi:hypothetical protein